jgi:hypothetical protein
MFSEVHASAESLEYTAEELKRIARLAPSPALGRFECVSNRRIVASFIIRQEQLSDSPPATLRGVTDHGQPGFRLSNAI